MPVYQDPEDGFTIGVDRLRDWTVAEAERRADRVGVIIDAVHARNLVELGDRFGQPFPSSTVPQ